MREIKFRAWDRKNKWMVNDALLIGNIGLGDGSVVANTEVQNGQELDWMQFTGLLEKNGKEIYEGDVVAYKHPSLARDHTKKSSKITVVEWQDARHNRGVGFNVGASLYNEIIGNIYENPDLLK